MAKNGKNGKNGNGKSASLSLTEAYDREQSRATLIASSLKEDSLCPQELLRSLMVLREVNKLSEKLVKDLEAKVLAHADAKGRFETGKIAITIKETARRNVQWKNEAIDLGEQVAGLKEEEFDEKAFEKSIQEKYPKQVSRKPDLVESL
jgi:hypothetical protein